MLGYKLRYRKGSFELSENHLSKMGAILRGAALISEFGVYDIAIFGGDGRLVATETEIAWLCEKETRHRHPLPTNR
jgi:hypothetical protein